MSYDPFRDAIMTDWQAAVAERNAIEHAKMQQNIDAYNDSVNSSLISNTPSTVNSLLSEKELAEKRNDNLSGGSGGFNKWASMGSGIAGGLMGIAGSYQDLASIADTSGYWNDIDEVRHVGRNNYTDFGDLMQDYTRMANLSTSYNYRDIRGKNDGQIVMGIGNSMLQGLSAGASTGNPYAMAAGAAIGLGAGIVGALSGNAKAKREQQWLQDNAIMAEHSATENLNAGHEQMRDYQFRSGISNRADWGGPIERRNQSIKEYADSVLHNKPKQISAEGKMHSIKRSHCNGGTMIRIKR